MKLDGLTLPQLRTKGTVNIPERKWNLSCLMIWNGNKAYFIHNPPIVEFNSVNTYLSELLRLNWASQHCLAKISTGMKYLSN